MKSILLIEDNRGDARLIREMLNEQSLHSTELKVAESMSAAQADLAIHNFDIILLDVGLPDAQGLEAVKRARASAPHVPLVVVSGLDDESLALQALQEGAQDYLIKGQIEPRGLLRTLRYAIERKVMEDALFAEKELAQVTLDSIGDAVICTNVLGQITFLNKVAEKLTGWPAQEAAGRPATDIFRIIGTKTRDLAIKAPPGKSEESQLALLTQNCMLIRRDGTEVAVEDCISPIHDREGRFAGAVTVFRDVSAARAMAQQIVHAAEHDFLTGLPNRMLLNDRITQAIAMARRHKKYLAVLFLDLDGFKYINDSLGHSFGDRLLQSVAQRLCRHVSDSDTVSRQGGDEFVVLLSDLERPEEASSAALKLLHCIVEPHALGLHDLHVTASIGVSVFPGDGADAETLIKNADTAMYQAKESGRQGHKFFKAEMNARAVERQSIEGSLRRSLERQEFVLYYQPKISLQTGKITGAEALIRWTHPTRGPISPAQFIPIAEDCGLILPIGAWVLREACAQAKLWQLAGLPPLTMAVNVSSLEFRNERFSDGLFAILDETGITPETLELELTESVLMKHVEASAAILSTLRDHGIQVAVDDFGTGYSSLSYLRKLPLDSLKIDQSFIRQISTSGADIAIVTAVIDMARNLKLRVVAEGVETLDELTFLKAHRCDEVQGYYFSRPVLPEQFEALARNTVPNPVAAFQKTLMPAS
jgi:diguanylate cyclase (GGDEF)-like protein/PAS domain S-box-containing protein